MCSPKCFESVFRFSLPARLVVWLVQNDTHQTFFCIMLSGSNTKPCWMRISAGYPTCARASNASRSISRCLGGGVNDHVSWWFFTDDVFAKVLWIDIQVFFVSKVGCLTRSEWHDHVCLLPPICVGIVILISYKIGSPVGDFYTPRLINAFRYF